MNEFQLPNINYQEELAKCKTMEDLTGKNGLMKKLIQDMMQHLLEVEMEEHLGRERYERNDDIEKNYRNGHSSKNVRTSYGDVNINVPRDRNSEFEPKVVKRYETVCNDLDNKVISLYARGLTVSDIRAELGDLYGIDLSESMVSKITDKVMASADEWQNRMLDPVYPIVFMDAIHYKVRQDGKIVNKAAYVCMGISMEGYKDILGIWIGENESAKFWLSVCNNLKNRGVDKILIACMDGLKGLPEAILSVYPKVKIQSCIIHQIRNSIKYISSKDSKEFMRDLKCVYRAVTEESALQYLDIFSEKWGSKYKIVIDSWYNNWDKLSTYFEFPAEIRKIIYTTNALEGFNRQLRKYTKNRTIFPTDDSLRKSLYLATDLITVKWTSPTPNWGVTLSSLEIVFSEELSQDFNI